MEKSPTSSVTGTPRLILHGGAGNITRRNLGPEAWAQYRAALLEILRSTNDVLSNGSTALDAATHAVTLLEANALFNAGHGAVFTRAGTNELEASVMVSRGKRKRGCAVSLLRHVKHPILLAKEMLVRGEEDIVHGGGAYQHGHLSGPEAESLAAQWGLDLVEPGYFWTKKRWEDHLRGLEREKNGTGLPHWHPDMYVPQGTVGAVALDRYGTLCVATSTGGLTNKLPGRVGDTPTLGAGFWAEEWEVNLPAPSSRAMLRRTMKTLLGDCFSVIRIRSSVPRREKRAAPPTRAVAMSGTGNGDSFLRLCACHTTAAMARFSPGPRLPLRSAVTRVAGPGGELQRSAGDRWGETGEGEGGIIGIEVSSNGQAEIVADFNCGGLFRTWIDHVGREHCMVFREEYELWREHMPTGLKKYLHWAVYRGENLIE